MNENKKVGSSLAEKTRGLPLRKILHPDRHKIIIWEGRKHHLVIFKKPLWYLVRYQDIRCTLFNWDPWRRGVKNWKWLSHGEHPELDCDEFGIIVPRLFWNTLWRGLSEQKKLQAFMIEAKLYTGPPPPVI